MCSSSATARVIFFARSSSAPAQPTQNRYSTSSGIGSPASTWRTSKSRPSVQSSRARGVQPPRVALVLQVAQHHAGLGREARLDQHLVAAHVHDVVDVLDVDRALLDAGAAGGAGPQHVRVDDAAAPRRCRPAAAAPAPHRGRAAGRSRTRAPRRGRARLGRLRRRPRRRRSRRHRRRRRRSRYGALANRWSRRSMITSLGDSGLPVFHAGHCDWHRPHSVQVAKSSMPFQVKSSTLPRPKTWSSSGSPGRRSRPACPRRRIGSSGPSPSGTPLGRDVDRGQRDVQVLGVDDDHQEGEDHRDVGEQEDGLDAPRWRPRRAGASGLARRQEANAHGLSPNGKTPVLIWAAAVEQQRDDDQGDHPEDHPGRAGCASRRSGTRAAGRAGALRSRRTANVADADQHGDGEEVLEEADQPPAADQRDVEVGVEQRAPGLEDRQPEDDEAPEREEVRHAGHRPLQQLALAEDLGDLGPQPAPAPRPAGPARAGRCGSAGSATRPAGPRPRRGHGQQQPEDQAKRHGPSSARMSRSLLTGNLLGRSRFRRYGVRGPPAAPATARPRWRAEGSTGTASAGRRPAEPARLR